MLTFQLQLVAVPTRHALRSRTGIFPHHREPQEKIGIYPTIYCSERLEFRYRSEGELVRKRAPTAFDVTITYVVASASCGTVLYQEFDVLKCGNTPGEKSTHYPSCIPEKLWFALCITPLSSDCV